MPYNPVETSSFLTNEQMGLPNFGEAIKQGMLSSQRAAQTAIKPRALSEKLLNAHLENSRQRILNQFLPQSEELRLATSGLHNSILGNDLTESNYKIALLNSLFGGNRKDDGNNDLQTSDDSREEYSEPSDANQITPGDNYQTKYGVLPSEEAYKEALTAPAPDRGDFNEQSTAQHKNKGKDPYAIDIEELKRNPLKRAAVKHALGYDPIVETSLTGPAREASDLAKLKEEVGEDSEVYQNAKASYDAQIDAKKDLAAARARTRAGLKTGEKEFFDEKTGVPLGKEIPLTAVERQSEEGNILFNELYPYVYKGAAPFSGEGSIRRLEQAAAHYKTDPKAKKLFDDFLLSEKLLAATTVNEASTLKAGKTNRTYGLLKESLNAQDIPNIVKKLTKEYKLPPSAQLHAAMRYQQLLSDARQKARKSTPATQKLFYNPEIQSQNETRMNAETLSSNKKEEIKEIAGKKYKKIEGEWHEI